MRHMEDVNYVFNGEIKGNFNLYILIYDNFFLLQAICLGCALRSSHKAKMAIFVVLSFLGLRFCREGGKTWRKSSAVDLK